MPFIGFSRPRFSRAIPCGDLAVYLAADAALAVALAAAVARAEVDRRLALDALLGQRAVIDPCRLPVPLEVAVRRRINQGSGRPFSADRRASRA